MCSTIYGVGGVPWELEYQRGFGVPSVEGYELELGLGGGKFGVRGLG